MMNVTTMCYTQKKSNKEVLNIAEKIDALSAYSDANNMGAFLQSQEGKLELVKLKERPRMKLLDWMSAEDNESFSSIPS